jgi:hypothetical protein
LGAALLKGVLTSRLPDDRLRGRIEELAEDLARAEEQIVYQGM